MSHNRKSAAQKIYTVTDNKQKSSEGSDCKLTSTGEDHDVFVGLIVQKQ
jgi:hypothetical protein